MWKYRHVITLLLVLVLNGTALYYNHEAHKAYELAKQTNVKSLATYKAAMASPAGREMEEFEAGLTCGTYALWEEIAARATNNRVELQFSDISTTNLVRRALKIRREKFPTLPDIHLGTNN